MFTDKYIYTYTLFFLCYFSAFLCVYFLDQPSAVQFISEHGWTDQLFLPHTGDLCGVEWNCLHWSTTGDLSLQGICFIKCSS